MLALLLAIALAPAETATDIDDIPEPPNPCTVDWAPEAEDYAWFVSVTEPMLLRRCSDLADVLNYEGPPESIHIQVTGPHLKFQVRIRITDGESTLYESDPSDVCECGSKELTTLAMQQVVSSFEDFRSPEETPPSPAEGPPTQPTPPPPKHTLRWVGVGFLPLGAAALAAGIPLHLDETTRDGYEDGTPVTRTDRNDRSLTVPLIVGGTIGVAAGVALIITDAVRTKRSKKSKTTLSPSLSPSSAGVSIHGRF